MYFAKVESNKMRKPAARSASCALLVSLASLLPVGGQVVADLREDLPGDSAATSAMQLSEGQLINQAYMPQHAQEFGSDPSLQIEAFISAIYQDRNGVLWFGTVGEGVIRYDGDSLRKLSARDGIGGDEIRGIAEDKNGNMWFATSCGITKYDGASFTSYTDGNGLASNDVRCITIDSKGITWVGTLQGVSRFDGKEFTSFSIPEADPEYARCEHWWFQGATSARAVHCIIEDSRGDIWFGTNGGAFRYDGTSLSRISEKEGLCDNSVNRIMESSDGIMWFATHHNGLCRWDGAAFTQIHAPQASKDANVWDVYEDKQGSVWFALEGVGVHRFDGKHAREIFKNQSCVSHALQCIYEDTEGRMWFGGFLGLFRYDGS